MIVTPTLDFVSALNQNRLLYQSGESYVIKLQNARRANKIRLYYNLLELC